MALPNTLNDRQFETIGSSSDGTVVTNVEAVKAEDELADTTNVAIGTTYYPSSSGTVMGNHSNLSAHHLINTSISSGSAILSLEATNDDATTPNWIDVSGLALNLETNTSGTSQFYVSSGTVHAISTFTNLNIKKFRFALNVDSGTADAVKLHIRRFGL